MDRKENKLRDEVELRSKAEEISREQAVHQQENLEAQSLEEVRRILHELQVHEIELEMQNEQLRIAQVELESSRARYFNLYDLAPMGYLTLSAKGLILEANLTAITLLGVVRASLKKKPISQLILPEDQDIHHQHFNQLLATGKAQTYELRMKKSDGNILGVQLAAAIEQNTDGAAEYLFVLNDITERRRAEEELKKSHENLKAAHQLAHIGIWNWVVDTDTVTWTEELYHIAGIDPKLPAPTFKEHSRIYAPESWNRLELAVQKAVETGTSYQLELELIRPDGSSRYVNVFGGTTHDNHRRLTGLQGTVQDITERKQAERALRENEHLLSESQRLGHVGSWLYNVAGPTLWSEEMYRLFGISSETITPSPESFISLIYPEDQSAMQAWIASCSAGERPGELEFRINQPDGTIRFMRGSGEAVFDAGGRLSHIAGSVIDITRQKRADEALLESEYLIRESQRAAFIGSYKADFIKGVWTSSEVLDQIFGVDGNYNKTIQEWLDIIHPGDLDMMGRYLREEVLGARKPFEKEYRIVRKNDGETRWVYGRGQLSSDDRGNPVALIGTIQDITERKRVEEELRESYLRLELAMEGGELGLWDWNPRTNAVTYSNRWAQMLGYRPEEVEPTVEFFKRHVHPEDLAAMLDRLTGHAEGRISVYESEHRLRAKSGGWLWVLGHGKVIERDKDGHPVRVTGIISDITKRKRAEEEKAKLEAQLQQAQKMESVGRLAGGVAHDFNNMLGVIIGRSEMALRQVDPAQPLYDDLKEIRMAAERSAALTRQLLGFARKQAISPKILDLNDTVAGMLGMLRRLIGEDLQLRWRPSVSLYPVRIDPSQIDQILANLCVNARDAIAGVGQITIETGNVTLDKDFCADHSGSVPGEYVRLTVNDNGCGMDKGTLAIIFEPFFTTKDIGKGTGLGLSMVYGIVNQNHGFIDAISEQGKGTTFTIYLPRYVGEVGKAKETEGAEKPATRGHETILLVEDESSLRKVTAKALEILGYTVLIASNPGEAIQLAKEHGVKIHLLVTDVIMPEMNGRDLAKTLLAQNPYFKCLFMSGYAADVMTQHGVFTEGVNFIQKPFSLLNLAGKIREVLDAG
jgi:PAS domain S-box-containing protein